MPNGLYCTNNNNNNNNRTRYRRPCHPEAIVVVSPVAAATPVTTAAVRDRRSRVRRGPKATGADRRRPGPTAAVDAAIRPALPTNRRRARSPAFSLHLFGRGYVAGARTTAHAPPNGRSGRSLVRSPARSGRTVHYADRNPLVGAPPLSNPPAAATCGHRRSRTRPPPSPTYTRRSSARVFVHRIIFLIIRLVLFYTTHTNKTFFFFVFSTSSRNFPISATARKPTPPIYSLNAGRSAKVRCYYLVFFFSISRTYSRDVNGFFFFF